jgi:methylisocitrate lyase
MAFGAPNALAAKLIEQMGGRAVYLSGAALSAGVLGLPDIGFITLSELAQQTSYLTRNLDIPVIVDADTGFGSAVHVTRTVVELEGAGAGGLQIEDQIALKRCGHLSGKQLVDADEMCGKIRAAVDARYDDDLVIIARTDARGVTGFADAVERSQRYLDAGADWIFPEALENESEFADFAAQVSSPLVANMTEFGRSPLLTLQQLNELGFAVALYPVTLLRVAMKAMQAAVGVIMKDETQESLLDLMQTRQELYDLLEYADFEDRDSRFFSGDSHE